MALLCHFCCPLIAGNNKAVLTFHLFAVNGQENPTGYTMIPCGTYGRLDKK
jgi:hypothetical protein